MEEMAQQAIAEQAAKHLKTLEENNVALAQTVEKLMAELTRKEELIRHLEQMLGGMAPIVQTGVITQVSDEEIIAMKQLEYLRQDALVRRLSLDEMKILDLAVKNKRLSQEKATEIKKSPLSALSTQEMLKIASTPIKPGDPK